MTSSAKDSAPHRRNHAALRFDTRHTKLHVEVEISPAGLGAIGLLVSAILLSVVPIIRVSGEVARQRRRVGSARDQD
jgi:hypothetical protein